jgi:hypothetical protein
MAMALDRPIHIKLQTPVTVAMATHLFVSMTPLTLSMRQLRRPPAMNRDSSLHGAHATPSPWYTTNPHACRRQQEPTGPTHECVGINILVDEGLRDGERLCDGREGDAAVRLEQLGIRDDPHLARVVAVVRMQVPVPLEEHLDLR